jgi:two-component system response regulator AtoC
MKPREERRLSDSPVSSDMFVEAASANMRAVEAMIRQLSESRAPVLLLGETGTGKRTAARRIHDGSGRRGHSFVVVDCATVVAENFQEQHADLLRSEGTVLLEEVGDLNSACQLGLLDLLDQNRERGTRARLICTSNRDLESDMRARRFREDLYYRISGVCLRFPPLRQRREDIPQLMTFFLSKFAADFGCPVPMLSEETRQLFVSYSWPGNIRELRDDAKAIIVLGGEALAMRGLRTVLLKSSSAHPDEQVSLKEAGRAAAREAQRELILGALARTRWNRRRAAQDLKISYKSLLYKLKQIGCSEFEAS